MQQHFKNNYIDLQTNLMSTWKVSDNNIFLFPMAYFDN
jgi:hypothetical protein